MLFEIKFYWVLNFLPVMSKN